jgi:CMP-N-acetylneuraminic acid synthetase
MYALLPMKENSERVPEKNFRILKGKPFFYYIADTLRRTGLFTRLVINTDSRKIINLAEERYGEWVVIIQRPKTLQGDYVSMNSVISYDVNVIGHEHDFMQTHSTNPFLKAETIKRAAEVYLEGKAKGEMDSLFSANVLKTRLYTKDLVPINHNPSVLGRTQDLDVIYEENSNLYFFSGDSFRKNNNRIGKNPCIYPMSRTSIESLDVDELSDWNFAEAVMSVDLDDY